MSDFTISHVCLILVILLNLMLDEVFVNILFPLFALMCQNKAFTLIMFSLLAYSEKYNSLKIDSECECVFNESISINYV